MSNDEKLRTVGKKLILLAKFRYGFKCDPLKNAEHLAQEVGIHTELALSAMHAAMDDS
ncbi:hypothetical protein [Paenibacillus sp. SN-8-1]|uniref:hypothetical protein n=1 Tax=Paenibacillus sp. SN-8-1 TaxID=3435409 RepID=UPI003D9A61CA